MGTSIPFHNLVLIVLLTLIFSCNKKDGDTEVENVPQKDLILVANSTTQWTGIAVSNTSRLFVNYPNWSPTHKISVAEITDTSKAVPYPNVEWNSWDISKSPADHFVCVQSVFIDKNNFLWILDPANPQREGKFIGVVDGGAKLVKVDLTTNQVVDVIRFAAPVITKNSYLNDVRIDEAKNVAFITESNEGSLVVVDLTTKKSRRVLSQDASTKAENRTLVVEGRVVRTADGRLPVFHADGLALDNQREYLYWRPTTGESLYRILTNVLTDTTIIESIRRSRVEGVARLVPSDGILFGPDNNLYLTAIENNAIVKYEINRQGSFIAYSPDLKWPDALANGPDDFIYVTTSQIHLQPGPPTPYKLFKFKYK